MGTSVLHTGDMTSYQPQACDPVDTQIHSKTDLQNATVFLTGVTGEREAPARACRQNSHRLAPRVVRKEKTEKTKPFGVGLTKSLVIYQAAQNPVSLSITFLFARSRPDLDAQVSPRRTGSARVADKTSLAPVWCPDSGSDT